MIFDHLANIDWLAVVIATVAYFVIGSLWYANFLFGKQYRAAIGQEEGGAPAAGPIVINLVAWFIAATALAWFFAAIGVNDVLDGALWGLVAAIGFIGTNRVTGQAYGADNPKLMRINGPYTLIGFAVMGAILASMA
ncbi:MAG: DUF1761 domain-containing protein [Acidimicrobiia bacterium]|nr:DUF1761 domain-containing protein [Acidimicrobiia bacterium]